MRLGNLSDFKREFEKHRPPTMAPRQFAAIAVLFWLFVGSLFVAPCAALAQVASTCGPGKNCTVQSITSNVTSQNQSTAWCSQTSGGGTGFGAYRFQRNSHLLSLLTGNTCSTAGTNVLEVNPFTNTAVYLPTANWYFYANAGFASGAAGTGTAFASFPVCNAGLGGRMLYDSTNRTWKVCDTSAWQAMGPVRSTPTILSGFGTSPSVLGGSRSGTLQIVVGTGGTANTGTVRLNAQATNAGWNCTCLNYTSQATLQCMQCTDDSGANGDIQFCSRNYSGTATAFNASDNLKITCEPF
jgi:hypothetical protein